MDKVEGVDLTRLLGFASLSNGDRVDFRDELFDSKLGAKVGLEFGACEFLDANDSSDRGHA